MNQWTTLLNYDFLETGRHSYINWNYCILKIIEKSSSINSFNFKLCDLCQHYYLIDIFSVQNYPYISNAHNINFW